ncbi:MAG: phospholipid/glycerol acyltransferase [Chitinophagaceae bacterium]|nr:phospholipid/glycerol acyltransferase [Chitinophagaceae bacterium]
MRSFLKNYWILAVLALVSSLFAWNLHNMKIDTDITNVFPLSEKEKGISTYLSDMEIFDRYTIIFSIKDSNDLDHAKRVIEQVSDSLTAEGRDSLFEYVQYSVDESKIDQLYGLAHDYLPFFLEEKDYQTIDSLIQKERMQQVVQRQYNALLSPAGLVLKKYFVRDPLGLSPIALKKFGQGFDQDITLDEGFFVSESKMDVMFFVKAKAAKNDYTKNKEIYHYLKGTIDQKIKENHLNAKPYIYGGALIAFQNSDQIKKDTNLTMFITLGLIVFVILIAFRNIWSPFLLITPVFFSALSAVLVIFYIQGGISGIAVGAGSVVLGIAIDFCIHFYSHYIESGSAEETKKDIFFPLLMGGITTAGAFFSLLFTESKLLQDLGLFAGIAILFAFLYTVTLMPILIRIFKPKANKALFDKANKWLSINIRFRKSGVFVFLLITAGMLYYAMDVTFDSDITNLAYKSKEVEEAEKKVNEVSKGVSKYLYFLAKEDATGTAVEHASELSSMIDSISGAPSKGIVNLFVTEQEWKVKSQRWTDFWNTAGRKELLESNLKVVSASMGIKPEAFSGAISWMEDTLYDRPDSINNNIAQTFLSDYNKSSNKDNKALIIPYKVDQQKKEKLVKGFEQNEHIWIIDRQSLINKFAAIINSDFQYVLTISSLLVLIVLFHMFGRIELALITFLPMVISWVWILGIMGINAIHFNLVNIILCTFIFGLGDDFSIFMTEAKLTEYKLGKNNLGIYRFAILLSCITTIAGMVALFWAKHPAIHSIAFISVVGILCVTAVSFLIIPALFDWFITSRVNKGKYPLTIVDIVKSVYLYFLFVFGALLVNVFVLLFRLFRIHKNIQVRYLVNYMIMCTTRGLVYAIFFMRKNFNLPDKKTLHKPSIIIANHRSFIDIVILTMIKPKIVLVAADWVWNVPILGKVLECGGYIRATMQAEDQLDLFKQRLKEGYSIVIFPEGTRNTEGGIKRFHKGAFYLAQECQVDIIPLLIHGSGDCITKGDDYIVKSGLVTIKTLPSIAPEDTSYGTTYQDRSKLIRGYMEKEYLEMKAIIEQPHYFRARLLKNYIYKGAVLEWYLWVKIRIEKDYEIFNRYLPKKGLILDLGCGYGFLAYMLKLVEPERKIIGVDYDEEKIEVASHGVLRDENISFVASDATTYPLERYDAVVISDVLHYLPLEKQKELIRNVIDSLNLGATLLIRDADTQVKKTHFVTRWSEVFSTQILRFNKTGVNQLEFVPLAEILSDISKEYPVKINKISLQKHTSNVLFQITKDQE